MSVQLHSEVVILWLDRPLSTRSLLCQGTVGWNTLNVALPSIDFLLPLEVVDKLDPLVRDGHLPSVRLQAAERNACRLGFMGMEQQRVDMLLVADEARSVEGVR